MISILGLITLFLRLSLAIQGQVVELSDLAITENKIQCAEHSPSQEIIYSESNWLSGNISLARKLEKEERVEIEGESFLGYLDLVSFSFPEKVSILISNSVFGNKAIRGSLPPLYDFFHSWKIHLS
ncbi:hypothetical protein D0X99_13360 [Algoriphagus lacus]|uniref:Uncharacterized protein n=1 Tax=Algoriphagus lacus TaxID=2056311 RepID=A0A418PQF4_9BACT|nr:hypothetical protein [Algoriphagus lacus]RIW14538.1 hypothetical protein D0X99_13360 [Algoriphagus lacus]